MPSWRFPFTKTKPLGHRTPNSLDTACVHAQLCPTLRDSMDSRPPGSSVHGISQARTLEWVVISSSKGPSQTSTIKPASHALAGGFFTIEPSGKPFSRLHVIIKIHFYPHMNKTIWHLLKILCLHSFS